MSQSPIATAADYADAMFTARRARNWVVALLLIALLAQIALFLTARYTDVLRGAGAVANAAAQPASEPPATVPAEAETLAAGDTHSRVLARQAMEYFIALTAFAGVVLAVVLSFILLLILGIMLVGRLIGVSQVTGAFIWSLVLAVLLFPWQALLSSPTLEAADFRIPGVLYGWSELVADAHFPVDQLPLALLKWSRFVAFPLLAILLVLVIRARSQRGLQLALGEAELEADLGSSDPPRI